MERYIQAVEKNKQKILAAHEYFWKNPETGFREVKTSKYLEDEFISLGYEIVRAGNIPGFYTVLDTGKPGPEVLVLGELDALLCPTHPDADPKTGAVHACGHSVQCAALLGIAAALREPGILDSLSGRIRLCAVPAEEFIELEYRSELKKEGRIKYLGGKMEFLHRGYFDGVDIAFMVHAATGFSVGKGSVGFMAKHISYLGESAHAGGSPWNGCNALYAANLGLSAVNAIRETFREADLARVHPIITHGGDAVNAIPDLVRIETYVRGSSFEAIRKNAKKVDRALCGGALSVGANIEIEDIPGYTPLLNDNNMILLAKDAAILAVPDCNFKVEQSMGTGSTDMGDLSAVMPAVHPYAGGASGTPHGNDYKVSDPYLACVGSAKWQVIMLYMLLSDGAEKANRIIAEFKPRFASVKEFLEYVDTLASKEQKITYCEERAQVKLG